MALHVPEVLKKHWQVIAIVGIVAVGGVVILKGLSGSASASPAASNPQVDAITAQANAQLALGAQSDSFQLAAQAASNAANATTTGDQFIIAQDTLAAQTATANEQLTVQAKLAQYETAAQVQLQTYALQTQAAMAANNNATVIASQTIAANEQTAATAAATALLAHESDNQTAVAESQTGAAVDIANINASVSEHNSNNSFFGSLASTALAAFAFL